MFLFRRPLVAGLMIHESQVALSFLPLSGKNDPMTNYVGDFTVLHNDARTIRLPIDSPATLKDHYKLLCLMEQTPEFAKTKNLCYYIKGGKECSTLSRIRLEWILRDKNIEVEEVDINERTTSGSIVGDDGWLMKMSQAIAQSCKEEKLAEDWAKKRGYK